MNMHKEHKDHTGTYYPNIAFVGAGNMARCIIGGLIATDYPPEKISASCPNQEQLHFLEQQFGVKTSLDNKIIAETSPVLVLAVKPQVMHTVASELKEIIQEHRPLVLSIAAGITETLLRDWLGLQTAIIRCMPNLPAFVGSGATGMYANEHVTDLQRDLAESIMRAIGVTLWVKNEAQMDVIAALSGSGPAYFFLVMEALEDTAVDLGLSREDAHLLTLQTALGAARLALSTSEPIRDLRERVTSKGGITEKALETLASCRTREAFAEALKSAHVRSLEIAQLFK